MLVGWLFFCINKWMICSLSHVCAFSGLLWWTGKFWMYSVLKHPGTSRISHLSLTQDTLLYHQSYLWSCRENYSIPCHWMWPAFCPEKLNNLTVMYMEEGFGSTSVLFQWEMLFTNQKYWSFVGRCGLVIKPLPRTELISGLL